MLLLLPFSTALPQPSNSFTDSQRIASYRSSLQIQIWQHGNKLQNILSSFLSLLVLNQSIITKWNSKGASSCRDKEKFLGNLEIWKRRGIMKITVSDSRQFQAAGCFLPSQMIMGQGC
jgi:hypothetical protein